MEGRSDAVTGFAKPWTALLAMSPEAGGWAIRHADLRRPMTLSAVPEVPNHVVWWWGALPVGTSTHLPDEMPLRADELTALAARYVSEQLAARDPSLAEASAVWGDGHLHRRLLLEAVRKYNRFAAIEALARPSELDAKALSVVVCTRDRPEALDMCLKALAAQRASPGEIVVVDNSKAGNARDVAGKHAVRYVHEPRPGLSAARNAGVRCATGSIVAFTDDDVEVDADWTAELALAFDGDAGADAVTGLVLPASLDTRARRMFQFEFGGFGSRFVPSRFDARFFQEALSQGAQVWRIGAGANMAFRRSIFERVGLFDERLGAGAAGCSEDSELWYRILAAGGACLYEPRAVVHHHHRHDFGGLRRQMRAYMKGHTAALLIQYAQHGHRGNLRRALLQLPRGFLGIASGAVLHGQRRRAILLVEEVVGWLAGLSYALRPGWRGRTPHLPQG